MRVRPGRLRHAESAPQRRAARPLDGEMAGGGEGLELEALEASYGIGSPEFPQTEKIEWTLAQVVRWSAATWAGVAERLWGVFWRTGAVEPPGSGNWGLPDIISSLRLGYVDYCAAGSAGGVPIKQAVWSGGAGRRACAPGSCLVAL
ncbi:hypothetical protein NDU88_002881 [Pleurodeles waltl]|uniref:Uncharacterized protein n=1 Tax=Pleurodeles waltl TaxID=8319 RepID=A0AAV7PBC1_PLEWA|nr:hypothetical protein NDU88_002881 [Pleurodeles waltl]